MAGKVKRAAIHKKRMQSRRDTKKAKRELYKSLAGTSKKNKKRNRTHSWRLRQINTLSLKKHKHLMVRCGNPACKKEAT